MVKVGGVLRGGLARLKRKVGRVDDCTGLENRSVRKDTGGSNPPPSVLCGKNRQRRNTLVSSPVRLRRKFIEYPKLERRGLTQPLSHQAFRWKKYKNKSMK